MYQYVGYMNLTKNICFFLEYTSPLWLIWLMWWSLCWGQVGQIRYESDTPDANYIYDSWAFSPSNIYSELSLITIHNHLSTYSLLLNAMALRHISLSLFLSFIYLLWQLKVEKRFRTALDEGSKFARLLSLHKRILDACKIYCKPTASVNIQAETHNKNITHLSVFSCLCIFRGRWK